MDVGTVITVISVLVAITSALFAWQAVKAVEKTCSVELTSQLYTYQSDEMLYDLKIVWEIYRQIWQSGSVPLQLR